MPVKSKPFCLFLFPVFFVLHGFTSNYDSVPVLSSLLLTAEYVLASLILTAIFWLLLRNITKAVLMTMVIMAIEFFFGNLFDLLKNSFPNSFISQYRFILPFSLLLFIFIFLWLKRKNKSLHSVVIYLNLLLVILILLDAGRLFIKVPAENRRHNVNLAREGFQVCDSCSKPDIFLIVPDQYSGSLALKTVFHFDNTEFEDQLRSRGFHIAGHSHSNYNLTPFSMASLLNMDYLNLKPGKQDYASVNESYRFLRNSRVIKFLNSSGYEFYNCSIFDFDKKPAYKYKTFLPYGNKLITAQTFTDRIVDDFTQDILDGKFHLKNLREKIAHQNLHYNDEMINQTEKIAARKSATPKFVYTHLMMPHYPYYFDRKGNPLPVEKLTRQTGANRADYLEYLIYTNHKLIELIDKILANSANTPVILLLSDHGLQKIEDRKFDFYNLNAAEFPGNSVDVMVSLSNHDLKIDQQLYDSITNVNEFRVLFNKFFNQQLPLLKDSSINAWD